MLFRTEEFSMLSKLLLLCVFFLPLQGVGESDTPDLSPYITFIERWTSYNYNGEDLPELKQVDSEYLQLFYYGDYVYAQAEFKGEALEKVLAYYDRKDKLIYVTNEFPAQGLEIEPTLVHELVHYMQDINGYTDSVGDYLECTEGEAYDVQALWQIMVKRESRESVQYVYERSILAAMKCMGNKFKAINNR